MDDGWRVDCFAVEEGSWDPRPANVCAIQAPSRRGAKDRGDLYLLIQPAPQSVLSQTAIDALKASAIAGYYQSAGSITRGLRAALVAGNAWLYEQNLRLDPDHRIALGLHYAVLRRQPGGASEVYLGQIGPALATWVHGSSAEQYPPDSIWLRSETPTLYDLDREPPAGWRREVEPNLYHITLAPGDTWCCRQPRLHHLVPPQALREALMLRGTASTVETVGKITQGRDLTVLVVEWGTREDRPAQGPLRAAARTGSLAHERAERRPLPPTPAVFPAAESSPAATEPAETSSAEAPFAASPEAAANATETAPLEGGLSPEAGQDCPPATATAAPIRNQPLPEIDAVPRQGALPEMESDASREERAGMPPSLPRERLRENLTHGVERARQGTDSFGNGVHPEKSRAHVSKRSQPQCNCEKYQNMTANDQPFMILIDLIPFLYAP